MAELGHSCSNIWNTTKYKVRIQRGVFGMSVRSRGAYCMLVRHGKNARGDDFGLGDSVGTVLTAKDFRRALGGST